MSERGKRGPYEVKHTMFCAWCNVRFEAVKEAAQTCGPRCRGRLKRYRDKTGFDPAEPPGDVSVVDALAELVAELFARERVRRMREVQIQRMPAHKRPPGE